MYIHTHVSRNKGAVPVELPFVAVRVKGTKREGEGLLRTIQFFNIGNPMYGLVRHSSPEGTVVQLTPAIWLQAPQLKRLDRPCSVSRWEDARVTAPLEMMKNLTPRVGYRETVCQSAMSMGGNMTRLAHLVPRPTHGIDLRSL